MSFSKPYMGFLKCPFIKVIPPPTTTTTRVTSRPAGLQPQKKQEKLLRSRMYV